MVALTLSADNRAEEPAVRQPVPFSHGRHIKIGLQCDFCHSMKANSEEPSLPKVADCMVCHRSIKSDAPGVKALALYYKEGKQLSWVRVYHLPGFVFFTHKEHVAHIDCQQCHGQAELLDVASRKSELSMNFCVNCHRAMKVSSSCDTCHQLPR